MTLRRDFIYCRSASVKMFSQIKVSLRSLEAVSVEQLRAAAVTFTGVSHVGCLFLSSWISNLTLKSGGLTGRAFTDSVTLDLWLNIGLGSEG